MATELVTKDELIRDEDIAQARQEVWGRTVIW